MSYYGEWDAIASEDWNRRDEMDRENVLKCSGLPTSEAQCDWNDLRPQVRQALIEEVIDDACATGTEPYLMEDDNGY